MKLLKYVLLSCVAFALLISCVSTGRPDARELPRFYLNPPVAKDAIYGVGDANMESRSMSKTMAQSRARDDIARQVEVLVKAAITDYAQQAGAGRTDQTIEFAETVSRQIVEVKLTGLRTIEVAEGRSGTIYVLMEYPTENFMDDASDTFKRNEDAAFAEFKAGQALDRLNQELENNPPRAGGDAR